MVQAEALVQHLAAEVQYGSCEVVPRDLVPRNSRRKLLLFATFCLVSGAGLLLFASTIQEPSYSALAAAGAAGGSAAPAAASVATASSNLAASDALLKKVEALIAQEKAISSAVSGLASGSAAAASAAGASAAGASAAGASAGNTPAGSHAVSPAGLPLPAGASNSGHASTASTASAADGQPHPSKVRGYRGRVGGNMEEAWDGEKNVPAEAPIEKPGFVNDTKKARVVAFAAIFILFAIGTFAAVKTYQRYQTVEPEQSSLHTAEAGEYRSSIGPGADSRSAAEKLAAVQEQQAQARRHLQQQQQQLALAQQQLEAQRRSRDLAGSPGPQYK